MDALCMRLESPDLEEVEIVVDTRVDEVIKREKNCLLLKLQTSHYCNWEEFKMTMRKVWKPSGEIRFFDMGVGIILVKFDDHLDKQRVLHDGPWNFDKCLLLTQEFEGDMWVRNIDMKDASF